MRNTYDPNFSGAANQSAEGSTPCEERMVTHDGLAIDSKFLYKMAPIDWKSRHMYVLNGFPKTDQTERK